MPLAEIPNRGGRRHGDRAIWNPASFFRAGGPEKREPEPNHPLTPTQGEETACSAFGPGTGRCPGRSGHDPVRTPPDPRQCHDCRIRPVRPRRTCRKKLAQGEGRRAEGQPCGPEGAPRGRLRRPRARPGATTDGVKPNSINSRNMLIISRITMREFGERRGKVTPPWQKTPFRKDQEQGEKKAAVRSRGLSHRRGGRRHRRSPTRHRC